MINTKNIVGAILLVFSLILTGCTSAQNQQLYTGNIEGVGLDLAFENMGKIVELSAVEGQVIHKGDQLGRLDVSSLELKNQSLSLQMDKLENQRSLLINRISGDEEKALYEDLQSGQNQLSSLKKDASSQREKTAEVKVLYESGAISSDQYEDAVQKERKIKDQIAVSDASLKALQIRIADKLQGPKAEELKVIDIDLQLLDVQKQEIELAIEKSRIQSPIEGIVEVRYYEAFEFVNMGSPIFRIIQTDQLNMTIYVPETELSHIKVGQKIAFTDESLPKDSFGVIHSISPVAEFTPKNVESTDSKHELVYRISLTVEDSTHTIKPGMFMTVNLGTVNE